MPIRTAIWKIGSNPEQLQEDSLAKEQELESMILASPRLLTDDWMLIGRQEDTGFGGRIDLLAIAPDGSMILIELKRDRTPREVVAQALDYATWVENLKSDDISAIYERFTKGQSLTTDFKQRFGVELTEDNFNQRHEIVIVAALLDDSSERIVNYLNKRGISINVLCFQVFKHGNDKLLSRSWLLDPVHVQINASASADSSSEPWNGEFYCSFGEGNDRSWSDAVKYGFICAGGGEWYSRTLSALKPGDRVWVKNPAYGFVGVCRVTGPSTPAASFTVKDSEGNDIPIFDTELQADYHKQFIENLQDCEYFVPVEWLQTVESQNAVSEIGLFGNQNTVCKPTTPKWRHTVERLKIKFPDYNRNSN
jgi:hypothetical protein